MRSNDILVVTLLDPAGYRKGGGKVPLGEFGDFCQHSSEGPGKDGSNSTESARGIPEDLIHL